MARGVLVAMVVIVALMIIAALVLFMLGTSIRTRNNMLDTTERMTLGKSELFAGNFQLIEVHFFNRSLAEGEFDVSPCNRTDEIVIAKIVFRNDKLPDLCEMTVDRHIVETFAADSYACRDRCIGDETLIIVDIEAQSLWKQHEIMLCCDNLCLTEYLSPICLTQQRNP